MAWTAPARQSTGTLVSAATWNAQVPANMEFLGTSHNHSGDPGDGATLVMIPSGAIALFDAACPTGWTRVTGLDGKAIRGAATWGGTGGADTHGHTLPALAAHTHVIAGHTHPGATGSLGQSAAVSQTMQGTGTIIAAQHTHTLGGATAYDAGETSGAATPTVSDSTSVSAYANMIFCKKD